MSKQDNYLISHEKIIEFLSRKEIDILNIFFRKQGSSLDMLDFSIELRANELEIEQVLDNLIQKKLVKKILNIYSGTSYRLTKLGRDIILKLNNIN